LAFDVSMQVMQRILPAELAGRLYISFALLGLPLATLFFVRQANPGGDALALWALVGVHSIFYLLTYLNFFTSLTFCFLTLGLWLKWMARPRAGAWMAALAACTALYFCHIVTFFATGIVVAVCCLFAWKPLRIWVMSAAIFIPGLIFYVHSGRGTLIGTMGFIFLNFDDKLDNLKGIMHGYSERLDQITLLALAAYFVVAWVKNRQFHVNWKWFGIAAVLFACYWALPWAYGEGSDLDVRMLPIIFGLIPAFARVGRRGWWLAPAVLLLFFARVENVTVNFREAQPELIGLAGSFEVTPMNARVLPIIQAEDSGDALHHPFAHFWAYGVIRRHWYSAYLFEIPGLNPLRLKKDAYTLDGFWDLDYRKETPDWKAIQEDYDYVWCYNAPQYSDGLGKIGTLAYENGKLRMFKINPPADTKAPAATAPIH
jgi:hypothetical protein